MGPCWSFHPHSPAQYHDAGSRQVVCNRKPLQKEHCNTWQLASSRQEKAPSSQIYSSKVLIPFAEPRGPLDLETRIVHCLSQATLPISSHSAFAEACLLESQLHGPFHGKDSIIPDRLISNSLVSWPSISKKLVSSASGSPLCSHLRLSRLYPRYHLWMLQVG